MRRDRAAYREQMERLARDAFAEHTGASKAGGARARGIDGGACGWHGGRVCIKARGTTIYAVEVLWLRFGRLLVHGDIAPVIMVAPDADFRSAVHRLAGSHIDYVADKVAEGVREMGAGRDVDRDVFRDDLFVARRDCFDNDGARHVPASVVDAFDEAIEDARHGGDAAHIKTGLYEGGVDPEILHGLGRVVAVPVWYAHAALMRVDALHGWRCPECDGKGWMPYDLKHGKGNEPCGTCDGRTTVSDRPAVAP